MTTRIHLLTLLILWPAPSLFGQGERILGSLDHDGVDRDYILYVPSGYDPSNTMPLVLNFHGYTSTAEEEEAVTGMNVVAECQGFLVAYPNAVNRDWTDSADHNIGFVESLLDTLANDYSVDSQRVYVTGVSQGGWMSFALAAALPDRFAAVAPIAGTRPNSDVENRIPTFVANTPDRAFPLLHMHGSADVVVPYNGGRSIIDQSVVFPSVSEVLDEWVDSNGGASLEQVRTISGFDVTDGPAVSLFRCSDCGTYANAAGDRIPAEVIHMRINGLGHEWPEPNTIDISTEIWNFFSRHELASLPGDFNADGVVNVADIDLLSQQIRLGLTDSKFDVNGDRAVDSTRPDDVGPCHRSELLRRRQSGWRV